MGDKVRWRDAKVLREEIAALRAEVEALSIKCALGDALEAERDELRAEVERLRKENDILRFKLAESAEPCLYCNLSADKMNECPSGFPGCGRADDMLIGGGMTDD